MKKIGFLILGVSVLALGAYFSEASSASSAMPELFGLDLSLSKAEIKATAKVRHVTLNNDYLHGENEEVYNIDMIGDLKEKTKDIYNHDTVRPIQIVFYKNVVKSLEYETGESYKFPILGVLNTLEKRFGSYKLLTGSEWYSPTSIYANYCVAVFESPDFIIAVRGIGALMHGKETCEKLKNKDKTANIGFDKLEYFSKTAVKLMNADFNALKLSEEKDRAKKVDKGFEGL